MSGTPKYQLQELKGAIQRYRSGKDTLWFSAPSRSIDCTIRTLFCDERQAEGVILNGLCLLEPKDFSSRVMQWNTICDVYGLEDYNGQNWYVKFAISQDDGLSVVEQISFHPLEQDLKVMDNRLLKITFIPH